MYIVLNRLANEHQATSDLQVDKRHPVFMVDACVMRFGVVVGRVHLFTSS